MEPDARKYTKIKVQRILSSVAFKDKTQILFEKRKKKKTVNVARKVDVFVIELE